MLIDTRGLSCPQPVLMVYPHLSGNDPVDVLVDNTTSQENVSRAAARNGWSIEVREEGNGVVRLELRK
ncbi:sulfurtransferase TusA family protein [uncultured Mailhella sp.]|uniref:sulfurtransferase TusA family protein n=1 Tax=uncultured Mailhella sp. TaxID=1981031 RepID=UPI00345B6FE7